MSDAIVVNGIRAYGRHGIGSERDRPQPLVVDVELSGDLAEAAAADSLAATVDYGGVARTVASVVEEESFELIEALAEAIAAKLVSHGKAVRVRVAKPWAARSMGVNEVAVVVERR